MSTFFIDYDTKPSVESRVRRGLTAQHNPNPFLFISVMTSTSVENDLRKERILAIAMGEGIKGATIALLVGAGATAFASYRSKKFNRFMSVSAKASIPVMSALGMFGYRYEITASNCQRFPERYGLADELLKQGKVTQIPIHHRTMNYIYDNPFQMVAGMGVPFAATVLRENMKLTHLTFSQKIMHSRVYAQIGVITILMTTMLFREYMRKRGRFPEPDDETKEVN